MKKILYFCVLAASLLIIQCSNEIPVTTNPINLELGKVSLKIDKANAPAEVVLVEAFLTREGYDTLYGVLNIVSSTSADITFEEVSAGDWHLKVDAKDSLGVVIYTGETDIEVLAGILTQVSLTLVPTGNGTGSIYIFVNWGTSSNWVDYVNNPVFTIENSPFNPIAVVEGTIIKEENTYKMWYNNLFYSAVANVGYAESENGINWTSSNSLVLTPGEIGSWDDYSVGVGCVIKDGNSYLMYYEGNSDPYGYWHIGLATSTDGVNWTKHSTPVCMGDYNEPQLHPGSVLKINNQYLMYYTFRNPNSYHFHNIGMAVSSDGVNWVKNSNNPILTNSQEWEGSGIYYPSVIYENNLFKMVYMNTTANAFGMATSTDGFIWNKSNSNPFFTKEQTSNNWAYRDIAYPNFIKLNNEYRIYYSGGHSNTYNSSIGFIRKFGN